MRSRFFQNAILFPLFSVAGEEEGNRKICVWGSHGQGATLPGQTAVPHRVWKHLCETLLHRWRLPFAHREMVGERIHRVIICTVVNGMDSLVMLNSGCGAFRYKDDVTLDTSSGRYLVEAKGGIHSLEIPRSASKNDAASFILFMASTIVDAKCFSIAWTEFWEVQ